MFERLRRLFGGESTGPVARPDEPERASGEEAWMTRDEEAREASKPGTPRLKWAGKP